MAPKIIMAFFVAFIVLIIGIGCPSAIRADTPSHDKIDNQLPLDASFVSEAPDISPSKLEPYNSTATPITTGELPDTWADLQRSIQNEQIGLANCRAHEDDCTSAQRRFLTIVQDGLAHTGLARIGTINRDINLSLAPKVHSDWRTPLEALSARAGDCKDYAITKYLALREAGVEADDIRLLIVRNRVRDEDHAVVAVRLDQRWIILDNRWLALATDEALPALIPTFELSVRGVSQLSARIAQAGFGAI